jgi:adenylylsulfate kinase
MENIRHIAEVSKLFLNCGIILICAFVSPTNEMRNSAREIIGEEDFIGVFVNTPIEICEKRDPKGLYRKARAVEIKNFTGISASFDLLDTSFIEIDNTHPNIDETVENDLTRNSTQPNKNTV